MTLTLWKYNKITGLWTYQREVNEETKDQWLAIFQKSEPNEIFKVAKRRPKYLVR